MSQINRLTLWDVNELFDYWQDNPPTHVLVAAYLMGGKHASSKRRGSSNSGSKDTNPFYELSQAVGTAGGSLHKKLPQVYRV